MKKLLFALAVLIFTNSCDDCAGVMCECATPSIYLEYSSDSISCEGFQNLVEVETYSEASDQVVEDAYVNLWDCTLALPLEDLGRYWVVTSDSLNISDTVRINHLSFHEDAVEGCCDCPAPVEEIELMVNASVYMDDEVVVRF